ncbi:hypothetical protein VE01_09750 [Pseudogymnoascus verrucosus]|uniref:Major facilitator superfamily (MFS) profile domain-containing protein n=1 Tax=Pseudogymnoascus verrucosus TaxID=342668 RepID=A0A1B8G895_9PEZI|nr:uncharacterized protein VE01_09750 [Pseudogymnoascus verrucosus]OBT92053.2 hypothetical protein VE01_09750 [Pseudogymnoascus verrucosus]
MPTADSKTSSDTASMFKRSTASSESNNEKHTTILNRQDGAKRAALVEKSMTLKECVVGFRKAVAMSLTLSLACAIVGYGLVLLASFVTLPVFRRDFACPGASLTEVCQIPASWQSSVILGPMAGQIMGLFLSGWVVEKFGYKKTILAALSLLSGFTFITFFATSLPIFLVGSLLCGIPWGIFQTITTNYASDICPTAIRGYVTAWTNVCWIIGQLGASIVLQVLVKNSTELSYKLPLGLQWAFPLPLFVVAIIAQESPWWLVRHNKIEEARVALSKLVSKKHIPAGYSVDDHLDLIIETNQNNINSSDNGVGYIDCFRPANLRRTEITVVFWTIQNACGTALMQWSAYFFVEAGLTQEKAFMMQIMQYVVGFVGFCGSWAFIGLYGRRTIELTGLALLCLVLCSVGTVASLSISIETSGWVKSGLLLVFTFVYGSSVGPITYTAVSEISSTRLRSKTMNIGCIGYLSFGVFNSIITPFMLNTTAWNWGANAAWFWAASCFLCCIYVYFRVPELKGRTFGEIDWLFANGISARNFAKTVVPLYEIGEAGIVQQSQDADSVDSAPHLPSPVRVAPSGAEV